MEPQTIKTLKGFMESSNPHSRGGKSFRRLMEKYSDLLLNYENYPTWDERWAQPFFWEMLEAAIIEVPSTATVGGTVHGGASSGAGGTVEFHTVPDGTASGHGRASSGAGGTVEFHSIPDGTASGHGGASSGAGGTVEFHSIPDGTASGHGGPSSGAGGTVEFHTIPDGTASGQGGPSSGAGGTVEFHTIPVGTASGHGGASSGAGGTVEFHTIPDGTASGHGGLSSGAGGTVEFHTVPDGTESGQGGASSTVEFHTIPDGTASGQGGVSSGAGRTQNEDVTLQEEPRFNITFLAKTFMMVSTANGGTIVTSRLSADNSLSHIDKILLASAVTSSTAGLLLCFGGYILGGRREAELAALLTSIGAVTTIFGFILTMSTIF